MTPQVLHIVDTFGARSQTFVYAYVTHHQDFAPRVLCRQRDLPGDFPFDDVTVIPEEWSRRHPARWWSMLSRTVTGQTPWQRRVGDCVRASRPDVVHAHFGQVGVRVLPAMTRPAPPLVTSFYGYDATGFANSPAGRKALPLLFSAGTLFLAEGPVMRQRLLALGAPAARVRVVPIAIDLSKYPSWSPARERPFVLFAARFVEKKGLPDAIAAFAAFRRVHSNVRLRIVGDGPEERRGREAARALAVDPAVEWLGPRSHTDLIGEMRRALVLIQPSLTAADGDTEGGAPTTVIEAQAIGLPIVATRHADIPHIAPPGPGIHLAEERDVAGLAAGLSRFADAHTGSDPAGVRARHDIRVVMPVLEDCYREALTMRDRTAA